MGACSSLPLILFHHVTRLAYFLPSRRWAPLNNNFKGGGGVVNWVWVSRFVGAHQLGIGCNYLGQGIWGILWRFDVCVSRGIGLLKRVIWVFLGFQVIVCVRLLIPYCEGNQGVNIPSCSINVWMRGRIYRKSYGNIWESIMVVGEFYKMYRVWWVWGNGCMAIFGGHNISCLSWALICRVLPGPFMCIVLIIPRLWCLGANFVSCWHLLRYITLCICWIGVCKLFGVLLCCVGLCEGLLCVSACKWRVSVATCQFHDLGKVCSWNWDMLVARRCSFSGSPCIGCIGILRFSLCIIYAWGLP